MLPFGATIRDRLAWWLYYAAMTVMAVPLYVVVLASFRWRRVGITVP